MVDAFAETLLETQKMLNNPGAVLAIEPNSVAFGNAHAQPSQSVFFQHLASFAPNLIEDATLADLTALHRMGVACRLCGQFDLAESFYRRALNLVESDSGCHSLPAAMHRNFLAGLYFMTGREAESIPLIEASLHTYINNLDSQHLYTRLTHFGLALAFARLRDRERAQEHYLRSELGHSSRLEAVDELRWSALPLKLMSLAAVKFEQGRFDESVELFRHCVIHEANEAWPGSVVVARALNNLATLCRSQGLDAEAGEFFRMTLKMKGDLMDQNSSDYQLTLKQYQDFLRSTTERRND